MKKLLAFLVVSIVMTMTNSALSQLNPANQADTNTYVVTKNDGKEYIGKILSDDGREILIMTESMGKLFIYKSDIRSIKKIDRKEDIVNGEYRSKGVFTTRYQFSTNSFPIEKGENYAMINLYGPEVHFAVTKNLSVGVMATWIASPMVLALKYSIPTKLEKVNFGFGTLLGTSGYLNQGRGLGGLHWGMVTFGDRSRNITLSIGYSYLKMGFDYQTFYQQGIYPAIQDPYNPPNLIFDYGFTKIKTPLTKAPVLGLGAITSVGKKASFVFDAMLLIGKAPNQNINNVFDSQGRPSYTSVSSVEYSKSTNLIVMPGMRFQKTENTAFQISLAGVIGSNDGYPYSFPIPMCSWFFKF